VVSLNWYNSLGTGIRYNSVKWLMQSHRPRYIVNLLLITDSSTNNHCCTTLTLGRSYLEPGPMPNEITFFQEIFVVEK